ncbi:hypothetical protein F2Q69_00023492 [Brassica cretica]|uniref:Uncharacterized protein n=1 Tax=Brassica cretica TaxID=69181 RepID=A0A8S9Q203_BRACR|nr:hypothetical protein F2Q69_00023492 [Brassica cretica]
MQLLSTPYMKKSSIKVTSKKKMGAWDREDHNKTGPKHIDLKSRGLSLVPISCTPIAYRDNSATTTGALRIEPLDIFDAFWNHGALASVTASSMGAKSENKNSVDFNSAIPGFVGIKRKQPGTQIEFIGVIQPSWEQWLNLRWKMSRRFQTLMLMLPNKFIISESYLTFTFYILAVVVPVLTAVTVFIINAIIVSVLIFFFYWFYMRPTKDCKTLTPSSCFIFFSTCFVSQKKKIRGR